MPSGSYIKTPLRFSIMHPLVPVVKILTKTGVAKKIWEKAEVKVLRDLTQKSVNFSALANSNIKLSLFPGEVDQQTKSVRSVKNLLSPKKDTGQ